MKTEKHTIAQLEDVNSPPPAGTVVICVADEGGYLNGVIGEIVYFGGRLRMRPLAKLGSYEHYILYGSEMETVWPAED